MHAQRFIRLKAAASPTPSLPAETIDPKFRVLFREAHALVQAQSNSERRPGMSQTQSESIASGEDQHFPNPLRYLRL
jgi:hypothetical protein